ncbi:MAG: MotA/TolQ/ExbB proton channel family protein [Clostridia bacterium]|nr:MotA/TolQ/ExbB proton channel family protein [Clostridia bacterium]
MSQFFETFFANALSGVSNLLVYIGIVVLFVVGLIRCIAPVVHTRGTLRRAIRSIRSQGDKKYAWQQDEFLGKGTLYPHWSEYLNNLFFADGVYHNASNVEDYINEETVMYGPGRASFADALPGLMTSLGFLGTLIGLAQGLSGFNMTDSAAVQQSIVTLIPGMRYAFTTSIFGVVGSVLFTLITRAVYGSSEHTLKAFYGAMSRYAGVLSVDPMTQIAIYQQEQTALIQTMAKDLNGAFTENITAAVHEAIDPLNQSFKNFVSVSTKEQMRFMDAVMQRFADRLDESLRGKLQRFGEMLDEMSRQQQESCVVVRASLTGAREAVADLQKLRDMSAEMMDSLTDYVQKLDDSRRSAEGVYDQLEQITRRQDEYLKTVGAMQADVGRLADAMQKAAADLRASAANVEKAHIQANKALQDEFNSTMDAYRDYVNQFTQRVDYLTDSISGALQAMPDAVNEANNRFLDQVDRMTDAMVQAQRALEVTADRIYRG